jgi:hypothetical protein
VGLWFRLLGFPSDSWILASPASTSQPVQSGEIGGGAALRHFALKIGLRGSTANADFWLPLLFVTWLGRMPVEAAPNSYAG